MTLIRGTVILAIAVHAASAVAQQPPAIRKVTGDTLIVQARPPFTVKTVTLHHLISVDAVKLLVPYIQTPGGGVYDVPNVRAVTIREVPMVFDQMLSVLEKYDREPAMVVLNFQLV
jgi:hypothetical protein